MQQYLNQDLSVRASASYLSCAGTSMISSNLKYTWSLTDSGAGVTMSYSSRVKDQAVYYLPKYMLTPTTYTISVTVVRTDITSPTPVSYSVSVTVLSSGLKASIYGGDIQSVRAGQSIRLDASGSVDNDVQDSSLASVGLSYAWVCNPGSSTTACTVTYMSGSSVAIYSASFEAAASLNNITLVVTKDTRSATASIRLKVVQADAAVIAISGSSVASGSKFVTSDKFTVSGVVSTKSAAACVATWSVGTSVGSVDVSTASGNVLSSLTALVAANASATSLSLVLAANALPRSATGRFNLGGGGSIASVSVVTNGAPQGGSFSVSPNSGTALTTSFALTTPVAWVDEDTPLTYQILIVSGGALLEVRRPLQVDNAILNLPAGSGSSNALTCVMRVFDSYGSYGSASYNVTVTAVPASALTTVLSSQLVVNATTDVDGAKLAVTLVTASLNGASCDNGCSSGEVSARQDIRSSLLSTLFSVSTADVIDVVSLSSMATSLAAITQVTSEISESAVTSTFKVALSLLSVANASSVTLSASSVSSILQSLSSVTVAGTTLAGSGSFSLAESTTTMVSLVKSCNDVLLSSMAFGEAAVVSVYESFSTVLTSQTVENGNMTAVVASSRANASRVSSVSIPVVGSVSLRMSTVSTQSWAYGNATLLETAALTVSVSVSVGSLLDGTRVVFVIQKSQEVPNVVIPSAYDFTLMCGYGEFKSVIHVCPDSGTRVIMNCTGGQELLKAVCPGQVKSAVCGSAIGDSSLLCETIDSTSTNVTCSCLLPSSGSSRRQLSSNALSTVNSVMDQTGVSHVGALTAYVGENFAGTLSGAADMNSAAAFRKVLIVIVAFIVLWTGGLAIVMSSAFRSKMHASAHKEQKTSFERLKRYAQAARSPVAIGEYLKNYVDEVFPSAFKDKPSLECLVDEIYKHHRYMLVVSCSNDKKSDQTRIITAVRLLTVQTMLMFLLAVFYELQAPSDDGSCGTHMTEQTCLVRRSIIEAHSTYCQWSENALREEVCTYRDPSFSYLTIMYVSVVISVITAIVSSPIDYFFNMLTAPTADAVKVSASAAFSKRMVANARRVSVAAMTAASSLAEAVRQSAVAAEKHFGQASFETREVPESTRLAHALAVAASPALKSKADDLMIRRMATGQSIKSRFSKQHSDDCDDDERSEVESDLDEADDESIRNSDNDDVRGPDAAGEETEETATVGSLNNNSGSGRGTILMTVFGRHHDADDKKFNRLVAEIDVQRKALNGSEIEQFDGSWGIDPTGEFVKRESLSFTGYHRIDAAANIKNEMHVVEEESRKIAKELKYATDQHIGLELLHLFVLDILGRATPAARIFQSKAEEDFFKIRVVSRRVQMLAWCGVVFMNLFFAYFTILKSYQKGTAWQRAFVTGSVVQILVEVLFNETMECIWVNFLVPRLVSEEVHKVARKLHAAIAQLCAPETVDSPYFLDAPAYLFVSTAVAKKFPNQLESMVVRAYHSHLPGMLSNKWHFGPAARIERSRIVRTASVVAAVLTGLQVAAASPFIFQRIVIRIAQPWLLTGIIAMFAYLLGQPVLLSFLCLILVGLIAAFLYIVYYRTRATPKKVAIDREVSKHESFGSMANDDGDERPLTGGGIILEENFGQNAGDAMGNGIVRNGDDLENDYRSEESKLDVVIGRVVDTSSHGSVVSAVETVSYRSDSPASENYGGSNYFSSPLPRPGRSISPLVAFDPIDRGSPAIVATNGSRTPGVVPSSRSSASSVPLSASLRRLVASSRISSASGVRSASVIAFSQETGSSNEYEADYYAGRARLEEDTEEF
jgi:hypothetical protein